MTQCLPGTYSSEQAASGENVNYCIKPMPHSINRHVLTSKSMFLQGDSCGVLNRLCGFN